MTLHEAIREAQSWLRNHPDSGPYLVRVERLVRGKWQPMQTYLVSLHALNPDPPQTVVDGGWRFVPIESSPA